MAENQIERQTLKEKSELTTKKREPNRENRRNWVRILVTYAAALYVFLGGIILVIAALWADEKSISSAKEIFTMVLPVATGIVTYWFASRQPKQGSSGSASNNRENGEF